MVGKRRKRPLLDSKSDSSKPPQWNITPGSAALPSPSPSVVSEQKNRPSDVSHDWTNMITFDDQPGLDFSQCDEQQFLNLELAEDSEPSTIGGILPTMHSLSTPSVSPPEKQFLSPADLDGRSQSSPPILNPSHQTAHVACYSSIFQEFQPLVEDDETVCIKLLAQLKRFSTHGRHNFIGILTLINKINATLRRLLQSRTIRTDYTCQLLLTNVLLHIATLCEQLLDVPESSNAAHPEIDFLHQAYLTEGDNTAFPDQRHMPGQTPISKIMAKHSVREAIVLCSTSGDLLKRKPLSGFQILGKQESAHVDIDTRLRRVLASLSHS